MRQDPFRTNRARELRQEMTPTEKRLWIHLRGRRFAGFKFRRQTPIAGFIADFYCHDEKLILEIDGSVHEEPQQKARDENRDIALRTRGFKILRFTNETVFQTMESVLRKIAEAAKLFYRP